MQATENLILQCLNELNKAALMKQTYFNYYNGNHAIPRIFRYRKFDKRFKFYS
jgi:hypothetical protein